MLEQSDTKTDTEVEDRGGYSDGFKQGFDAAKALFGVAGHLEDSDAVKTLPAGSCVKDARGRVLFRTRANGWMSTAGTHFSSMYLALPVEVLYHA